MKKICLVLLVCLVAAGAWAYRPAEWLYFQWPYAYSMEKAAWYYFNEPCSQWCIGLPSGGWQYLSQSGAGAGWNYYQWPYCYSMTAGGWYYLNENLVQWCVNLNDSKWSRLGQADAPSGNYLVIDLSGGPDAASYPVSEFSAVPPGGWTDEYKTTKLVLRRISAGTTTNGSPPGEVGRKDDETQYQVRLTEAFYVGVFEVTQKQWERVMGYWPSFFTNAIHRDARPVENMSYDLIRGWSIGSGWPGNNEVEPDSFMGRLRTRTGQAFDLPTEAQWEYACRAGVNTALNSGYNLTNANSDVHMDQAGRYGCNGGASGQNNQNCTTAEGSAKVGSYLVNNWGLYDMHGNVWEWCLDWYGLYPIGAVVNPKGPPSGSGRVIRSGSWQNPAHQSRAAERLYVDSGIGSNIFGFRIALWLQ